MFSEDFLKMVRCPVSGRPLTEADEPFVARLNAAIAEGIVPTRIGNDVTRLIDGGLIDAELQFLMPVRNGIPNFIPDETIPLDQVDP